MLKTLQFPSDKALAEAVGIAPPTLVKKKRLIFANELMTSKRWDELIQLAKDNKLDHTVESQHFDVEATNCTQVINADLGKIINEDEIPDFSARP